MVIIDGAFQKSNKTLQKENDILRQKLEDLSEAATKAADEMAECFKEKGPYSNPYSSVSSVQP